MLLGWTSASPVPQTSTAGRLACVAAFANLYEATFIRAFGASTDFTDANLKRAILEEK